MLNNLIVVFNNIKSKIILFLFIII
jgi:hypothetical protein